MRFHSAAAAEFPAAWKNCPPLNAFAGAATPTEHAAAAAAAARPSMPFPVQSGYLPTFGYGTAGFLSTNFLRPDYPVS